MINIIASVHIIKLLVLNQLSHNNFLTFKYDILFVEVNQIYYRFLFIIIFKNCLIYFLDLKNQIHYFIILVTFKIHLTVL